MADDCNHYGDQHRLPLVMSCIAHWPDIFLTVLSSLQRWKRPLTVGCQLRYSQFVVVLCWRHIACLRNPIVVFLLIFSDMTDTCFCQAVSTTNQSIIVKDAAPTLTWGQLWKGWFLFMNIPEGFKIFKIVIQFPGRGRIRCWNGEIFSLYSCMLSWPLLGVPEQDWEGETEKSRSTGWCVWLRLGGGGGHDRWLNCQSTIRQMIDCVTVVNSMSQIVVCQ